MEPRGPWRSQKHSWGLLASRLEDGFCGTVKLKDAIVPLRSGCGGCTRALRDLRPVISDHSPIISHQLLELSFRETLLAAVVRDSVLLCAAQKKILDNDPPTRCASRCEEANDDTVSKLRRGVHSWGQPCRRQLPHSGCRFESQTLHSVCSVCTDIHIHLCVCLFA